MNYNIHKQLPAAMRHENDLDKFFEAKNIIVKKVNMNTQRNGIDRLWTYPNGLRVSVEYKADSKAAQTNNVFIETVSVDKDNKLGWAYTSLSQYLVYYIPPRKEIYMVWTGWLKLMVEKWKKEYKELPIKNVDENGRHSYFTYGMAIPINRFREECKAQRIDMKESPND